MSAGWLRPTRRHTLWRTFSDPFWADRDWKRYILRQSVVRLWQGEIGARNSAINAGPSCITAQPTAGSAAIARRLRAADLAKRPTYKDGRDPSAGGCLPMILPENKKRGVTLLGSTQSWSMGTRRQRCRHICGMYKSRVAVRR